MFKLSGIKSLKKLDCSNKQFVKHNKLEGSRFEYEQNNENIKSRKLNIT